MNKIQYFQAEIFDVNNRIKVCKVLSAIFAIPMGISLFWVIANSLVLLPTFSLIKSVGIWGLFVSIGLCLPLATALLVRKYFLPREINFDFSKWIMGWGLAQFLIVLSLGALVH